MNPRQDVGLAISGHVAQVDSTGASRGCDAALVLDPRAAHDKTLSYDFANV
jgi:hypothetical protein